MAERFWSKVNFDGPVPPAAPGLGPCWLWTASIAGKGYGQIYAGTVDGRLRKAVAHRWAYEALIGPVPDGLVLDHLCRVRLCVNPWHLEPVPNRENLLRGDTIIAANASRTHCPAGHPYDNGNTHFDRAGSRHCRPCGREAAARRRAAA